MMPSDEINGFTGYRKAREPATPPPWSGRRWLTPLLAALVALSLGLSGGYVVFNAPDGDGGDSNGYGAGASGPGVALVGPADGARGDAPTLYWHGSGDGVLSYTLRYTPDGGATVTVERLTTTSYALAALPPGDYTWEVEVSDGTNTDISETWSFTILEPTNAPPTVELLGPADDAELTDLPALYWSARDADSDDLATTLAYGPAGSGTLTTVNEAQPGYRPASLTPGEYEWRVEVDDGVNDPVSSQLWYFTIVNTPPVVELLGPADDTEFTEPPALYWSASDGDDLETTLYYTSASGGGRVPGAEPGHRLPALAPGDYQWQVEVSDGVNAPVSSPAWEFTILPPADLPPEVELLYPEEGQSLLEVTLVWAGRDPEGGAVEYDLYLDDSDTATLVATTSDNRYTPAGLALETTYYWKVVASDGSLETTSPVWSFTLAPLPETSLVPEADFDAAEELIEGGPLAQPMEPVDREAEMAAAMSDAENSGVDTSGASYSDLSDDPPAEPDTLLDDDADPALEQADLNNPRHGPAAAGDGESQDDNLANGLAYFPTDDSADLDRDYGNDFAAMFADPFGGDEGRGTLLSVRVIASGDVYDNNSDGNPEYVRFFTVGYGALGNASSPEYESLYISEIVITDPDSDGNFSYLSLSEFGFESYDGDHDGQPEYAAAHIRWARAWDNDSDGNPEHILGFEADYVMVDADGDNASEFQAGRFASFELWDNNSDGRAESLAAGEWSFLMADRDNDTNPELLVSWASQLQIYDNNSDGNPESAEYVEFGYGAVDNNSDGDPELEIVTFKAFGLQDPNSTGNAESIEAGEAFFLHATADGNFTLAHATQLAMVDNNSDGHAESLELVEWSYASGDADDDGNKEFEAVEFSSFLMLDNFSNGNPTFVKATKLQAWMWDADDDGENETGRVIIEIYVREDDDGDGVPEQEYYWRWDSDDE